MVLMAVQWPSFRPQSCGHPATMCSTIFDQLSHNQFSWPGQPRIKASMPNFASQSRRIVDVHASDINEDHPSPTERK